MTFIVIILLVVIFVLGKQIQKLRCGVRDLEEAARNHKVSLGAGRQRYIGFDALTRLELVVNELIREVRVRSETEQSTLDQVRTTLGSIKEGVLIIDGENYVMLANEAFRHLIRIPSNPVGKRLESIISGADFFEFIKRTKVEGVSDYFVLELKVGKQSVWVEVSGTRLPDQSPTQEGYVLFVLHDITKQKQLEKIRSDFIANVSHELRTPVTIIKGFTDTLVEDQEFLSADERLRFLSKIQNNVGRLHQMLEELLQLSRMETDPDALQLEWYSLNELIEEVAENFRHRLNEGEHELCFALSKGMEKVMLDPLRISQVIENMMENALRHAKGLKTLKISTGVEGAFAWCEIEDDGAGIPEADLPHVFERFYRVDKGRSRELGGTGLGLSIVKHIVQQHGGEITARSEQGEGTVIRFTLPLRNAGEDNP